MFGAVVVAGMAIIARAPFNRRNRFILTASISVGVGAILVPNWFSKVFTYNGNNQALLGFFDAIVLVMETGFAVTSLLALLLNLIIAEEVEVDARLLRGRPEPVETSDPVVASVVSYAGMKSEPIESELEMTEAQVKASR